MLGLTVDMHQKSLALPFQTQLLRKTTKNKQKILKQKQPQTSGIKNILLVLNKPHFILNRMTSF